MSTHRKHQGWRLLVGIPTLIVLWVLAVAFSLVDGIVTAMIVSPCKWATDTISAWIVDLSRWIK